MQSIWLASAALAATIGASAVVAQTANPNLARSLAATCANCHGTNGVSVGGFETLAGMSKDDLVRKLKEYKAGTKPGTIMPQLAKGYTDEQIEAIAGWLAVQN